MIILLGDIHGEFYFLTRKLDHLNISDATIICVGDFGVSSLIGDAKKLNILDKFLGDRNLKLKTIRGNHDNPFLWTIWDKDKWPNIEFIPDYTTEVINNQKWLFIGGAVSIDRPLRIKNKWMFFENEPLVFDPPRLVPSDVLVMHTAPSCIGYTIQEARSHFGACLDADPQLEYDLVNERKQVDRICEIVQPSKFFAGHFHNSLLTEQLYGDKLCEIRILDILELYEYRI
jgi:hypothetical protein